MKQYRIKKQINADRPIIFLCGPYYDKDNASDRRNILKDELEKLYSSRCDCLPLIIDDFLTRDNINDDSICIQLLEELFASIASYTYIYLDTMSSATELGIFANNLTSNIIRAFIPKISDTYNKGNVGYFVKDVVLKEHDNEVKTIEYRPLVKRVPIATDYTVEHYYFVGDSLPNNIKECIYDDYSNLKKEHQLAINKTNIFPEDKYTINYFEDNEKLSIRCSVSLLFYIVCSILHNVYSQSNSDLRKKLGRSINYDDLAITVKTALLNTLYEDVDDDLRKYKDVDIYVPIGTDFETLLKHILAFVDVFLNKSEYKAKYLVKKSYLEESTINPSKKHYSSVFSFSEAQKQLINEILDDKSKFFREISIISNGKKRDVVTYQENEFGMQARALHEYMVEKLYNKYNPHECSFAYQKGKSIKLCITQHLGSNSFIKVDIKKFFNSIQLSDCIDAVSDCFEVDKCFLAKLKRELNICFYKGMLPLGFVTSPVLSDIYLYSFDNVIYNFLSASGKVYTRYADDIMISSNEIMTESEKESILVLIENSLLNKGLKFNKDKIRCIDFDASHSFIKYLGVNIINENNEKRLSVGKSYIYSVAKEYLRINSMLDDLKTVDPDDAEACILKRKLQYDNQVEKGKLEFIRQIEGERGVNLFVKRINKYYPNLTVDSLYTRT